MRLGPVSLGGHSEEKGDYMGGEPPWGMSGLSHILGTPVLGSSRGKTSPLGWLEGCETNRRAVGSLDSALEECAHACLLLRQGGGGGLKTVQVAGWFPVTAPMHTLA